MQGAGRHWWPVLSVPLSSPITQCDRSLDRIVAESPNPFMPPSLCTRNRCTPRSDGPRSSYPIENDISKINIVGSHKDIFYSTHCDWFPSMRHG